MKKKGLIVATIVMVLVLAVSLTTATYAWFTTTSVSTISSITIATANGSDIAIGLKTNGARDAGATAADFKSGTVQFNDKQIVSGDEAMGASIVTGINLSGLSVAVGTGVIDTETAANSTADSSWSTADGHVIIAGNGTGATAKGDTLRVAKANRYEKSTDVYENGDYIDWVIGFMPTVENVDTITLNITINPTTTKTTLGLLAALHIRYSWDGAAYTDLDVYSHTTNNTYGTLRTAVNGTAITDTSFVTTSNSVKLTKAATKLGTFIGTDDTTTNIAAGAANVALTVGTGGSAMTANTTIHQLHLQIFYAGYDSDCVNSGLGVGGNMLFTITSHKTTD